LGIGTAPKALISHGINTTIVELDPIVHYFATKYFALPSNHTVALVNALSFVDDVARSHPGSYDYIIHDVFTGGAEPAALFTVEFLAGLYTLLQEDGVIAIVSVSMIRVKPMY
jgi:spermidine synthase